MFKLFMIYFVLITITSGFFTTNGINSRKIVNEYDYTKIKKKYLRKF